VPGRSVISSWLYVAVLNTVRPQHAMYADDRFSASNSGFQDL